MKAPLYNRLVEYSNQKMAFHMPGHKFGSVAELSKMDLTALDNTEAIGMDNLYEANGIIKEAMELMRDFYGAKDTLFLTNGSTSGIITSILATCNEGDQIIIARNSHHSVWSGMTLAGVIPIYISPEYLAEDDILGQVKPSTVEKALADYPNAKAVLIVSPTYEGIVSNIKEIAEIVHKNNKVLIVDEAHGAHLALGNVFPESSITLGADIVINSMHKTLPTLTQSGLLHLGSSRVRYERLIECLRMIQTSSPSYMMMGVMDYARGYIIEEKEQIEAQYILPLVRLRDNLIDKLKILSLFEYDPLRYDPSKIIISTMKAEISGYELAEILNDQYNIVVEAALDTYVILMTTLADTSSTLTRLEEVLLEIDGTLKINVNKRKVNNFIKEDITIGISPRSIYYGEKRWEHIKNCLGKVVANNIMLYPPGIPIICTGETISEEHIELINRFKYKMQGIKIQEEILVQVV